MIDEQRRKMIAYASLGFIVIVVLALIGYWLLRGGESDLPPIEDTQTQTSNENEPSGSTPSTADTAEDASAQTKNGVIFYQFGKLQRYSITSSRVDVIVFTLANYANSLSDNPITNYTFDEASFQETSQGERRIFTFNATASNDKTYKVELSYVYSADAFVRVFEGDKLIQKSY